MMNIKDMLSGWAAAAFVEAGYDGAYGTVSLSGKQQLCDYQCNGAMAAAKAYGKAPMDVAKEVAGILERRPELQSVQAVPPGFVNLRLSDAAVAAWLGDMAGDSRLGLPLQQTKTILMDYGGPNVAKPLHVGHLRSAIIGQAMDGMARFLGHRVISDVHLGDWGLQMGLVIREVRERYPDLCFFDDSYAGEYPGETPVTLEELCDIYPAAAARSKTDEAYAKEAARATVELQDGRRGYRALWRVLRDLSVADLKASYEFLGVGFDWWKGESDADAYVPKAIAILRDKALLHMSQGAEVVEVAREDDKEPMPPIIIVKSDGGDMYGTTDVATILQRMEDVNPDELWYFTDKRQALHFKQVFRCAALMGVVGEDRCRHIPFGTMNGKDGKPFKTREGGVMRLGDLIDTVSAYALSRVQESQGHLPETEQRDIARKLGMSALKIGDFINQRQKDFIFDLERFMSSEGKTGPYLLYTAVRACSVLEKAAAEGIAWQHAPILPPLGDTQRAWMLSLLTPAEALTKSFADAAPHILCECMFDIAGHFNRFYFENKILTQPDEALRASWLRLLDMTARMLTTLLNVLGIDVPERM